MQEHMEVPHAADLQELCLTTSKGAEPWITSVESRALDNSFVSLTWDEIERSIDVRWSDKTGDRLRLYREAISKISIRNDADQIEFRVWSKSGNLGGQLVISVGDRIKIVDTILST